MKTQLIVIAGGFGTRFWPKSTKKKPKQFLTLHEKSPSLLLQTLHRIPTKNLKGTTIITTVSLQSLTQKHLQKYPHPYEILVEPQQKNTAACIFLAAKHIQAQSDKQDPVLTICPADHYVKDIALFQNTLQKAIVWAKKHPHLVLLGVRPTRAETGFGYLEYKKKQTAPYPVLRFIEKPNEDRAHAFLKKKTMLWNSGIFVVRCSELLKAFQKCQPLFEEEWQQAKGNLKHFYHAIPEISFDYAVLEHTLNSVTFPLDCEWDDMGSYPRFFELAKKFESLLDNNISLSDKIMAMDAHHNLIDVPKKLVALLGVHNLIIIDTPKSLLIIDKNRLSDLRQLVGLIGKKYPDLA